MSFHSRRGFSLIEILVSVGILCVVLALGGGIYIRYENYSKQATAIESNEDVRLWLRQRMDCSTTLTHVSGNCSAAEHVPLYDENDAIFVADADATPRTVFNRAELFAKCLPDPTDPGIVRIIVESLTSGELNKKPIFDSISPLCILRVDTSDPQICDKFPLDGTVRTVGDTLVVTGSNLDDLWDVFYGAIGMGPTELQITYRKGSNPGVQSRHQRPASGKVLVCAGDANDQWNVYSPNNLEFFVHLGGGNDRIGGAWGLWHAWGEAGNDFLSVGGEGDVHGGAGGDTLGVTPAVGKVITAYGDDGDDMIQSPYNAPGTVVFYGGNNNDTLSPPDSSPNFVFGEGGDDSVLGGAGNTVLVGGPGNDFMRTNGGRDIVIGGVGMDSLMDGGGAIYIGGTTSFDDDLTALKALIAEWTSGQPMATRTTNLSNGTGATGGRRLVRNTTVFNDAVRDQYISTAAADWIFFFAPDVEFMPGGTMAP